MDKKLKESLKYYDHHYYDENTSRRIKQGAFEKIGKEDDKRIRIKKPLLYCSVAAFSFLLIFGSVLVYPPAYNALTGILQLNSLFEDDSSILSDTIYREVEQMGYSIGDFSMHTEGKVIEIGIEGNQEAFAGVKEDVEETVYELLSLKGLDAYEVDVFHYTRETGSWNAGEVSPSSNSSKELQNDIETALKEAGYEVYSANVRINETEKFIPVEIPVLENRKAEMKEMINNLLEDKGLEGFTIKFYQTDPKLEEAAQRWGSVITTIHEGLIGRKDLKVEQVGFSFYPPPLLLKIYTSIEVSDPNAKDVADEIEKTIDKFIHSDEVKENVKGDPYRVKIYSKNKELINQ